MLRWSLYIPPGSPDSTSSSFMLLFCVWVLWGISYTIMQASGHVCLTFCSSGWTILEFGDNPWKSSSPRPLLDSEQFSMGLFQAGPWGCQSVLLKSLLSRVVILLFVLFPFLTILKFTISWWKHLRLLFCTRKCWSSMILVRKAFRLCKVSFKMLFIKFNIMRRE